MWKFAFLILFAVCYFLVIVLMQEPQRGIAATSLIGFFVVFALVSQYRRSIRQFEGDFILRRQDLKVSLVLFLIVLLQIISVIFNDRMSVITIGSTYFIVLFVFILRILIRKYKPVFLVVKGTSLIVNYSTLITDDLTELTKMRLLGFSDHLILTFKSGKVISIKRNEYLDSDIQKLITICKETSQGQLEVSDNLK